VISAIANQFGNALVDAPFITIVSLMVTPESKGRILGLFMIGNSIARAALSAIGGAVMDWHWRNAPCVFIFFSLISILFLCFVGDPKVQRG